MKADPAPRALRPPRLALRFALVGLAQTIVIATGLWMILEVNRPGRHDAPDVRAVALRERLLRGAALESPAALRTKLDQTHEAGTTVTVLDPTGHSIASTDPRSPRCGRWSRLEPTDAQLGAGPRAPEMPPPFCAVVPITLPDGMGELHYLGAPPLAPPSLGARIAPFALFVVALSSLLVAWSLVRPLRRLSEAARALGAGDLSARARVERTDEIGDVARAFDEMAERITHLLRAEKELIANISHELRTPLARIRVALDLATEGDEQMARDALLDIAEDLDELERLLADVLTAARLDLGEEATAHGGVPPLRQATLDLGELVELSAARFRTAHPDRPLSVELQVTNAVVEADAVLLRRAIDNLLDNAHAYTDEVTLPIHLHLGPAPNEPISRAEGAAFLITITDRGVGMNDEQLSRVFQPFFRADPSRTRSTGGLGLGLLLAKRIVEAHGGTLGIESAKGRGTTVRLTVPAGR